MQRAGAPAKPKLVFAHGWGFHAGVWSHITPHFDDYEIMFWGPAFIKGGPPVVQEFPSDAVCIAYSFGVAQVLKENPPNLRGLISIGGFDSLVARGREEAVRAILSGLLRNPYAQMRAFWASCGINRFAPAETIDAVVLEQGLLAMLETDTRHQLDALTCPVLGMASADDRVIPFHVSKAVWEKYSLLTSQSGGHGLPVTRTSWCVENIKRFLSRHDAQTNN